MNKKKVLALLMAAVCLFNTACGNSLLNTARGDADIFYRDFQKEAEDAYRARNSAVINSKVEIALKRRVDQAKYAISTAKNPSAYYILPTGTVVPECLIDFQPLDLRLNSDGNGYTSVYAYQALYHDSMPEDGLGGKGLTGINDTWPAVNKETMVKKEVSELIDLDQKSKKEKDSDDPDEKEEDLLSGANRMVTFLVRYNSATGEYQVLHHHIEDVIAKAYAEDDAGTNAYIDLTKKDFNEKEKKQSSENYLNMQAQKLLIDETPMYMIYYQDVSYVYAIDGTLVQAQDMERHILNTLGTDIAKYDVMQVLVDAAGITHLKVLGYDTYDDDIDENSEEEDLETKEQSAKEYVISVQGCDFVAVKTGGIWSGSCLEADNQLYYKQMEYLDDPDNFKIDLGELTETPSDETILEKVNARAKEMEDEYYKPNISDSQFVFTNGTDKAYIKYYRTERLYTDDLYDQRIIMERSNNLSFWIWNNFRNAAEYIAVPDKLTISSLAPKSGTIRGLSRASTILADNFEVHNGWIQYVQLVGEFYDKDGKKTSTCTIGSEDYMPNLAELQEIKNTKPRVFTVSWTIKQESEEGGNSEEKGNAGGAAGEHSDQEEGSGESETFSVSVSKDMDALYGWKLWLRDTRGLLTGKKDYRNPSGNGLTTYTMNRNINNIAESPYESYLAYRDFVETEEKQRPKTFREYINKFLSEGIFRWTFLGYNYVLSYPSGNIIKEHEGPETYVSWSLNNADFHEYFITDGNVKHVDTKYYYGKGHYLDAKHEKQETSHLWQPGLIVQTDQNFTFHENLPCLYRYENSNPIVEKIIGGEMLYHNRNMPMPWVDKFVPNKEDSVEYLNILKRWTDWMHFDSFTGLRYEPGNYDELKHVESYKDIKADDSKKSFSIPYTELIYGTAVEQAGLDSLNKISLSSLQKLSGRTIESEHKDEGIVLGSADAYTTYRNMGIALDATGEKKYLYLTDPANGLLKINVALAEAERTVYESDVSYSVPNKYYAKTWTIRANPKKYENNILPASLAGYVSQVSPYAYYGIWLNDDNDSCTAIGFETRQYTYTDEDVFQAKVYQDVKLKDDDAMSNMVLSSIAANAGIQTELADKDKKDQAWTQMLTNLGIESSAQLSSTVTSYKNFLLDTTSGMDDAITKFFLLAGSDTKQRQALLEDPEGKFLDALFKCRVSQDLEILMANWLPQLNSRVYEKAEKDKKEQLEKKKLQEQYSQEYHSTQNGNSESSEKSNTSESSESSENGSYLKEPEQERNHAYLAKEKTDDELKRIDDKQQKDFDALQEYYNSVDFIVDELKDDYLVHQKKDEDIDSFWETTTSSIIDIINQGRTYQEYVVTLRAKEHAVMGGYVKSESTLNELKGCSTTQMLEELMIRQHLKADMIAAYESGVPKQPTKEDSKLTEDEEAEVKEMGGTAEEIEARRKSYQASKEEELRNAYDRDMKNYLEAVDTYKKTLQEIKQAWMVEAMYIADHPSCPQQKYVEHTDSLKSVVQTLKKGEWTEEWQRDWDHRLTQMLKIVKKYREEK